MPTTIHEQQNLNNLPVINLVAEHISEDLTGSDLINGKLAYQQTSNELQTVVSDTLAKILTSQQLAVGTDLVSATIGKLLTTGFIAPSGSAPANADQVVPTLKKVQDAIASSLVGALVYRGTLGTTTTIDLTTNTTGNAYLDGSAAVKIGDFFIVSNASDVTLVCSDGNKIVKNGDWVIVLNDRADTAILASDLDDIDAGIVEARNVVFDNTGSNLTATNTEDAIKEVNTKIAGSIYAQNGIVFTAGQVISVTHNLDSSSIAVDYRVSGSNRSFIRSQSSIINANVVNVQFDVAGTYDVIVRKFN